MKHLPYILLLFTSVAIAAPPITPDSKLTPGVVDPKATQKLICTPNYTKKVRDVTESEKKKVFAEYNVDPKSDKFEVDHLISLELGGSNDIGNLWPQSYTTKPYNAHIKDALEDRLHKMVCSNQISLEEAQKEISSDWIAAYKKYNNK